MKTDHLLLLSRAECGLCEEMEAELRAHAAFVRCTLEIRDVDTDAILQRRYGLRVPVLLDAWNEVVCEARFDDSAFERWCEEHLK